MSRTLSIACVNCKTHLWIGQRNRIYKSDKYMNGIEKFLFDHFGHELLFDDNINTDICDFKEIELED